MDEKVTLARCGMDCTACRFAEEAGCPGCMYCLPPDSEGGKPLFEDEECEVGICCNKKGLPHCGKCRDFPCDMLKEVSYSVETGDGGNRLLVLKAAADSETDQKQLKYSAPAGGIIGGLITGIIIGCATGRVAAWIFAGLVLGTGMGFILLAAKEKKRP